MGGRGCGSVFRAGDVLEGLTWLKPGCGGSVTLCGSAFGPVGTTGQGWRHQGLPALASDRQPGGRCVGQNRCAPGGGSVGPKFSFQPAPPGLGRR